MTTLFPDLKDYVPRSLPTQERLRLRPCSFKEACEYVKHFHRHHKPPVGHKFSIAVEDHEGNLHGVVMVGRPVARALDNGLTLEVNRCCTDGSKNACSMLYGATARASKALGYSKIITYTLPSEGGASLRAAGWAKEVTNRNGVGWSNRGGGREENHPDPKDRWVKLLRGELK